MIRRIHLQATASGSPRDVFRDQHGLTTTGVVVSLLVTLALVFSSAQVYRINSLAADVQDVADAAALAAENQVAKFMLIARTCDAVVLSMSLAGVVATGIGAVALCIPAGAEVGTQLIDAGSNILKARDNFADKAASGLNRAMKFLPVLSAAQAMAVAQANNVASGDDYWAIALLVNSEGKEISFEVDDSGEQVNQEVAAQSDEVKSQAEQAEQAAQQASAIKQEAFNRDCGDNPGYCMYERANALAWMPDGTNPLYTSVDAWTFSVALARAQAYYEARYEQESPADWSVAEQARSALRERFYAYACQQMSEAYVYEDDYYFDAYFPHLPRNTQEMRETSLYTDSVYPISVSEDGSRVMHAWSGCPEIDSVAEFGSVSDLESGDFELCPQCQFEASSLGSVASASTSISNGFEYHYEAVAQAAEDYKKARGELDPLTNAIKQEADDWFNKMTESLKKASSKRIEPEPPGSYGSIAVVLNLGSTSSDDAFASGFVTSSGTLGTRAAVSAATLVDEGSSEGKSAISSMLDGISEQGGVGVGAAGIVLTCWSNLLSAYTDGQQSLENSIKEGLDALPLASQSGLGTWASQKLSGLIESVGLQPAKIGALKPVLVNTGHVASASSDSGASAYLSIKKQVAEHPLESTNLFSSLLSDAEKQTIAQANGLGSTIEIAAGGLFGSSGPSISISLPVPEAIRDTATAFIEGVFDRLKSASAAITGGSVWE